MSVRLANPFRAIENAAMTAIFRGPQSNHCRIRFRLTGRDAKRAHNPDEKPEAPASFACQTKSNLLVRHGVLDWPAEAASWAFPF